MIRRVFAALLLLILMLVLLVFWLLSTTTAARWLAGLAQNLEPRLEVTVTGGSLLSGLAVESFAWQMPGLEVGADSLTLEWDPGCLARMTVCVQRIESRGLRLAVDSERLAGESPPEEQPADSGGFSLPVAVELEQLKATDTDVLVDGNRVQLASLETAVHAADNAVRIRPTRLSGLRITLPEPPAEAEPAAEPSAPAAAGPVEISLPDVELPLAVTLERLTLTDATLERGALRERLNRLVLALEAEGDEVRLNTLELDHPRASGELNAAVTLSGDWPLSLTGRVTAPEALPTGEETLRLEAGGSLAALKLRLTAEGPVTARVDVNAEVLSPDIPWQAHIQSEALGWPLDTRATVAARGLDIQAEGDLSAWRVQLATALNGESLPEGHWELAANGDRQSAEIERLVGETLDGRLRVTGTAAWAPRPQWDATLSLDGLDPGVYRQDLAGDISGEVRVSGAVEDAGWRLQAEIPEIAGRFRGHPLAIQGSIAHSVEDVWSLTDVRLASGDNRITAGGQVGENWQLDAELALPAMDALWPGLAGRARGQVAVTGALTEPSVAAELSGDGLAFNDTAASSLSLSADVNRLARGDSSAELTISGVRQGENAIGDVSATATGSVTDHRLEASVDGEPLGGSLTLTGAFDSAAGDWDGALAEAGLNLPDGRWRLAEPAALQWSGSAARLTVAAHCWRRDDASVCLTRESTFAANAASAALSIDDYALGDLDPWLPEGIGLDATVSADAELEWDGGDRPTLNLTVASRDGRVTLAPPDLEEALELAYQAIELRADLGAEQANIALSLDSERLGNGEVTVRIDPYAEGRPVNGEVRLDGVPVAPAEPFVPAIRDVAGEISVSGKLAGDLTSPAFDGEVRLSDGRVGLQAIPMTVEDIQVRVGIAGRSLNVQGDFRIGDGTGRIGGNVQWAGAPTATVALAGERLAVKVPPYAEVEVSPALAFNLTPNQLRVTGRIGVPFARITVEELPQSAVGVSQDVVIVDRQDGQADGEAAPEEDEAGGFALSSNIYVVLGDDVRFSGFGAEGRLDGALQLREVGTAGAEANGEIKVIDGTFKRFGQELTIRRGQFIFAGPISQPRLDIEAVREVGDVVAGLRVTGSATQPVAELFSEPSMPESDILTYLVTGRAPGSGSPSSNALLSQAALSLGVLGGQGIGASLAGDLGVENFRLEGGGDDGDVAVAGDISPNLMVRYGVGVFEPGNTLTLRYTLTQNLYLEAVTGLDNALDIFYSFDF